MNNEHASTSNGAAHSNDVHVLPDACAAAAAGAELFGTCSRNAIVQRGRFSVALAGGSTPKAMYALIAEGRAGEIDWPKVHVFFGDERCVAPTDPESNHATATTTLLSRVPIPASNIHRIAAEQGTAQQAAEAYERELRAFFARSAASFDLTYLGMGDDGHTASLFPGDDALRARDRWCAAVQAPASYKTLDRVTLTLPCLNASRRVCVLVCGEGKRATLARVRGGDKTLPAALVHGREQTLWIVDKAAAG